MYGTVEKILFLKSTPLFSGLTGEDLAPLARVAEVCSFPAHVTVLHHGNQGDFFYVVIRGSIAVLSGGRELERITTCGTLGELAVLDRQTQSADFKALEPCELLRVGADEFFQVLREQPEIAESLLRLLAGEVRKAQKRLADTLTGHL
jgi:CRP-like cAMP-binding protein